MTDKDQLKKETDDVLITENPICELCSMSIDIEADEGQILIDPETNITMWTHKKCARSSFVIEADYEAADEIDIDTELEETEDDSHFANGQIIVLRGINVRGLNDFFSMILGGGLPDGIPGGNNPECPKCKTNKGVGRCHNNHPLCLECGWHEGDEEPGVS